MERNLKSFILINIFKKNISKQLSGIYRPHCHCKKNFIVTPKTEDVNLIIPEDKISWLFKDKIHKMHDYRYYGENKQKIVNVLADATIKAYVQGKHECNAHDERGFCNNKRN